jgi:ABC-type branched-subunit amino acid transport system substrate-binding protein
MSVSTRLCDSLHCFECLLHVGEILQTTLTALLKRNLFNFTTGPPVAIVGPYCSETVRTVSKLAAANQMTMISFGASSSSLSSAAAYPTFLRMLTSTSIQSRVILSFLAARGISSFALIRTTDTYGLSGASDLADWGPTYRVRLQQTVAVSVTASLAAVQTEMQSLLVAGTPAAIVAFCNGGAILATALEAAAILGVSTSSGLVWLSANSGYDSTLMAIAQSNAKVRVALTDVFFVRRSVDPTQAVADFELLYGKVYAQLFT